METDQHKNHEDWVIQTAGLSKRYGKFHALKSLDLLVARNSIYGFLGPNGAGKTTTIKLLLGLTRPSTGSAALFGMDIVKQSIDIRARVGYLPQEPRFYDHLTARQTLRFTAKFFFAGPAKAIEKRVNEMLVLFDLTKKADRPIRTLSGGEKQRLGIAQAQVNYPDLLILDEPAASLDPIGRRDVLEVMSRLREYTTVFYSTHILDDVQRVSDRVVILNQGELVSEGTIEDLLAGNEGVKYIVHLKGPVEDTRKQVLSQPWVSDITTEKKNGKMVDTHEYCLQVGVTDPQAAEAQLFKLFASGPAVVTEFHRKKYELEEVFMKMIDDCKQKVGV
jgi:ABC-2 type transport system ATP-binding protein